MNDEKGSLMSMINCLQRRMISNEISVDGCFGGVFPDCVCSSAGNVFNDWHVEQLSTIDLIVSCDLIAKKFLEKSFSS